MADRLYTSLKADEYISALRSATNLDKAVVARLAFAYSITTKGKEVPESTNFSGGEMKRPTFVGNDEVFLRTLIGFVYQKGDIDAEAATIILQDFVESLQYSPIPEIPEPANGRIGIDPIDHFRICRRVTERIQPAETHAEQEEKADVGH